MSKETYLDDEDLEELARQIKEGYTSGRLDRGDGKRVSWSLSAEIWWEEEDDDWEQAEGREWKEKAPNGTEVGMKEVGGLYYWTFTNYGSKQERAEAIDYFHNKYQFENWE